MSKETEDVKTEEPEKETATEQVKTEKTLKESEVNALMAKQRKSYETELKLVSEEYANFRKQIEDKQAEAEAAAKEKVEKLREGLPENLTALLDKLTATDQLEWLSDPTNTITKQTIKPLPEAREGERRAPSIGTIV